ncbi:MAG: YceH family protein [Magnetococcales bacterium]|nr:YceH family protein [Magnetococcales bacterium]
MTFPLDELEVRILGVLLEKRLATPDVYPLSLNALINACNQKSNRHPVMSLEQEVVIAGINGLRDKGLVMKLSGGRVDKYGHFFREKSDILPKEEAILAVLLLRGPQTLGEICTRCERLHSFQGTGEVESTLASLIKGKVLAFQSEEEPMPWAVKLPVQPGRKEPRYAHLFMGEPDISPQAERSPLSRAGSLADEVAQLRRQLQELREEFDAFKTQFD